MSIPRVTCFTSSLKKTDLTNVHTNTDLNKFLMPYIISTKKNLRKIFEMKKYADILICQKTPLPPLSLLKKAYFERLASKCRFHEKKDTNLTKSP